MIYVKLSVIAVFVCLLAGRLLIEPGATSGQSLVLDAPTGLSASDGVYNNKVGLHWDAIRGAAVYRVFRSTSNEISGAVEIGTTSANTFFDIGVTSGIPLFYWVRAENGAVESAFSDSDQGLRAVAVNPGPVAPLEPPPAPPANPITAAKTYLGKALFWDEQLSSTGTVACGTCHHAGSGGVDPRSTSPSTPSVNAGPDQVMGTPDDIRGSAGVAMTNADGTYIASPVTAFAEQVTARKSVSHVNSGYPNLLFWDGRASGLFRDPLSNAVVINIGGALENQALEPPLSSVEMAHIGRTITDLAARVADSRPLELSPTLPNALRRWIDGRSYPELFAEAFGSPEVTPSRIAMAIATYQRTQFSDRAPIDLANGGIAPLTDQEQRGRNVFNASSCNVCHGGSLFSDNSFRYIGVRPQGEDLGRFNVTGNNGDRGSFRVPSLRNVGLRNSFFHNGQFTSLEQVVAFYNRGGDFNAPNKPQGLIRPLGLNANQQADLVAFLRRPLTDMRVATETERFDRPVLYMESSRVPRVTGTGRAGSGGVIPSIKAISPPLVGNSQFVVSVSGTLGNSTATLVVDSVDPGVGPSVPASGDLARVTTTTQNSGAGNGWASVAIEIPDSIAVVGRTFFARWHVSDPEAASGFSVTPAVEFTIFGNTSEATGVSIGGRVLSSDGLGVRNATVVMTDSAGVTRRVTTSSFGIYLFENVPAGHAYTLSVSSKRYRFAPQVVMPSGNLTDIDFLGLQ